MTAALFARGGMRATSALPYVSALPSAFVHGRGRISAGPGSWRGQTGDLQAWRVCADALFNSSRGRDRFSGLEGLPCCALALGLLKTRALLTRITRHVVVHSPNESHSWRWCATRNRPLTMDRTQTDFLRLCRRQAPLVEIDRAGCSTMGGALSPGRLDVLLTFRAHDQDGLGTSPAKPGRT